MVAAIDFAVRTSAGGVQRGSLAGDGQATFIQVGSGDSVSLNLSRSSVVAYEQQGRDLLIKLSDGREITLSGYFDEVPGDTNRLYLSADGEIVEVLVNDQGAGVLFADYGPVQGWEKWSPLDDLRFADADPVSNLVVASNEPAGMAPFIPGLLGGLGGLGGLAAVGGAAVIIGGGGGGDGGRADPTVTAQPTTTVTTNTPNPVLVVTGTGEPGDAVVVTIGTEVISTVIGTDGTWTATFPSTDIPADGNHTAVVVVTPPDGTAITLTGPAFVIDTTPPAVSVTDGTLATGDVESAVEYANGVTITGEGEPGASIAVLIGTHTQTTTVGTNGTWAVTFTTTQVATGEYQVPVRITATDLLGNVTVVNDTLVVDTVPHPITFSAVTTDNLVNLVESQSGLVVTGTSTAGATLSVTLQGVTQTAVVGSNGTWSVTYPAGTLPGGEYTATLTATTTDSAGNASTQTHSFAVDTLTSVAFSSTMTADNIINATEAASGVVMTGTSQPGSTVNVAWNGSTLPATVGADGNWSVTFPTVTAGTYTSTATVTATDAAGNTASATRSVQVDTQTSVTIGNGQFGGDNVLVGSELQSGAQSGVTLTGTAEPGASVVVTFEGLSRTVTAGSTGAWSASYGAGEVRTGTYTSTVSVTATDAAGNTATTSRSVNVDTEVQPFARSTLSTGSDAVLNNAEAAQGLTVTGQVEPGSSVVVRLGNGSSLNAAVAADGTWSLTIPGSQIPTGESSATLTATATDRYGNTSVLSEQVAIDRVVRNFASTGGQISGDGVINAEEAQQGLTLTGTSEPGSTIVLRLANTETVTTTASSAGTWSATFAPGTLPQGELTSSVTITATDRAGNIATSTRGFEIDTVAPGSPEVVSFSRDSTGLRAIGTASTDDLFTFNRIDASGNTSTVTATRTEDTVFDETNFRFSRTVPDGSYLVINTEDQAGNESSTLLIVNNTTALEVNLSRAGLSNFDFSAIDLTFAPDAELTINEQQLLALTGPDRSLIILGGEDDSVTLTGATASGATQVVDGETYRLYTLGTGGASVLVDDDIQTFTPLV